MEGNDISLLDYCSDCSWGLFLLVFPLIIPMMVFRLFSVYAFMFAFVVSTKVLLFGAFLLNLHRLLGGRCKHLLRLGCRVPRKAPYFEVNLRGPLGLGKITSAIMNIEFSLVPPEPRLLAEYKKNTVSSPRGVDPGPTPAYRCARTKLITPDLTCPSTHQLLWNSGDDSGPDLSFDKSASLERLFSLARTYRIPLDLHPRLPDLGFTMDRLPGDAIGIYSKFLWFLGIRIPFSTLLLSVLKYFKVHISQLVPLGLNKVVSFEVVCRDLNIVPTVTLFCVFQCLCKQGDWFSFSKRRNAEDVCMDDGPSSLKKWKDKFFLIDRRAIPDYLTWRHSCSCVSDDLPTDGYDRNDVERLCARLICLREMREEVLVRSGLSSMWFNKECDPVFRRIDDNAEMSIYDFMTLPSWSDAKVVEESHHLSLPLLERVPSHTTAPAAEEGDALAEGVDETDLSDFCAKIEDSLERDKGVSTRVVSVPIPRLSKRLGAPSSMAVVSASEPSHVGTSAPACTSGRSLSLGGDVVSGCAGKSRAEVMRRQLDPLDSLARSALARDAEYDQIPDDDFGTATRGEEIDLTLFPLAPGPYHMHYPYEGVSSPLYNKKEWDMPHAPKSNILCKDIFKDPDVFSLACVSLAEASKLDLSFG
ncbi:hypothetical protein Tco_0450851 [Tanacetum coccineum]